MDGTERAMADQLYPFNWRRTAVRIAASQARLTESRADFLKICDTSRAAIEDSLVLIARASRLLRRF